MSSDQCQRARLGEFLDSVRARYREERDKRLRRDTNHQYRATEGALSWFEDDPYVTGPRERGPLTDEVEVTIVGAGLAGLVAGARLREAGVSQIRLVDRAGDVGGAWYWNRYPGAKCDIEAYIYLPLLEEIGEFPRSKYATQAEIYTHCQSIAKKYELYEDACFQTAVDELTWDEGSSTWIVSTSKGDRFRSRFVIVANGPLSRPKLPGVPGIEKFRGKTFHTSRWDYDYTGGDRDGGLTGLGTEVVGIIGTGATAVQCIPHLGASAEQLFVFQRTPSPIWARHDKPTDPEWVRSLEPGWQAERMMNFDLAAAGKHDGVDLVDDSWTRLYDALRDIDGARKLVVAEAAEDVEELAEVADFIEMERLRARVDAEVSNPGVAASLKPYYRAFCKRPCFHDDYLPTFNRPNVRLIDTGGQGIERFTETGAVVDGQHFELDCLIFATGFETSTSHTHRLACDPVGRAGVRLSDHWAKGPRTLFGLQAHGFPNAFFLGYVQSGTAANYTHSVVQQVTHVIHILTEVRDRGGKVVDVTEQAEQEWIDTMVEHGQRDLEFWRECTPSRFNDDGNLEAEHGRLAETYGGGPLEFWEILRAWRAAGDLRGLRIEQ